MSTTINSLEALPPDGNKRQSFLQTMSSAGREFWGRVIVAALFILPLVAVYAGHLLYTIMGQVAALNADPEASAQVVHSLRSVGFLFLSVIILLCLLSIYFVFFLSVRVYGPQIALLRFIEQLKAGNYDKFRSLRKDDQLKEIWAALQDLANSLKDKRRN